jgi:lysophospholipase L1-like esterase
MGGMRDRGVGLKLRRRVAFGCATALGAAFALELLLQLAAWSSERVDRLLSLGLERTLPDARLGARPNPALPDHDVVGWRNELRPERAAIVAIGDSQTYGDEVQREDAWPQRLGRHVGSTTYNLALGGYGPVQYLRLVDDAMELSPELVLVGLYSGNDLADAYAAVHERGLAPELLPDTSRRAALAAVASDREDLAAAWRATGAARRGRVRQAFRDHVSDPIELHSRLFGLARALVRAASPPTAAFAAARRKPWEHYAASVASADPDLLFAFHDEVAATVLTPAARAALLDPTDPRVEEGIRIALSSLELAAARCAPGCRVAVVGIPTKEFVFAERVVAAGVAVPPLYTRLIEHERAFWSRVRAFLDERRIPFIETTEALRSALGRGEDQYPPDWNGHPNAAGNDAIALAVARYAVGGAEPAESRENTKKSAKDPAPAR